VSQGSVATYARCGGSFNTHLTTNLPRNLPVKNVFKSVHIWQNCGHECVSPFLAYRVVLMQYRSMSALRKQQKSLSLLRPTCISVNPLPTHLIFALPSVTRHMWLVKKDVCPRKKVKVAHTRLPSVGFRSWSWFLAVSLPVMWVINPAVGCHYFPPGLQLPPQPLRGLLPILLLGKQRHNWCEQFA